MPRYVCECGGCPECMKRHKDMLKRKGLLKPPAWRPPRQPYRSRPFVREEAEVIRDEYAQGKEIGHLADEFGVHREKIVWVLDRVLWGDVR